MFTKALKESGSGFFAKSGVSWVDFVVANNLLTLKNFAPDLINSYPDMVQHCKRVHELPQLQKYLSKRKESKN